MTVISVHLSKTAGSSFSASLKLHFNDRYKDDYNDQPISQPRLERFRALLSAEYRNR